MADGDTSRQSKRAAAAIAKAERETRAEITKAVKRISRTGSTKGVERALRRNQRKRLARLRKAIEASEQQGAEAARKAYKKRTGKDLEGKLGANRLNRARRIIERNTRELVKETARDIENLNRAVAQISEAAKDVGRFDEHVARINRLAQGSPELKRELRKQLRKFRRHGDLARYSRDVLAVMPKAKKKAIDAAVKRRAKNAIYRERTVIRTESRAAYGDAYLATLEGTSEVIGHRWMLSPSHPRPDICDLYAGQDLDGLGPGGYKSGDEPTFPAHPNCMCYLDPIFDSGQRRTKRTDGDQWLSKQPVNVQRQILGPTRQRALKQGKRVTKRRGEIKRVKNVR